MPGKTESRKAVQSFATAFAGAVSEAMSEALQSPWALKVLEDAAPPSHNEQAAHFRIRLDGGLKGECFIEFYQTQISELAAALGSSENDDEKREALGRVLSSASNILGRSLLAEHGEVSFQVTAANGVAFGGMFVIPLAASPDTSNLPLLLYFDGQLLAALEAPQRVAFAAEAAGFDPANLKLVMDVELTVSLRFGQRQLPLREVLDLSSGSVIELDRMVDEPVELLLDGKVIARGEAVIVDGNYGLRVTEIPQPMSSEFLR